MTKPPFPELIDSTQLSSFGACEHKWLYEHAHHLSPLAINPDLHAGGAFARGVEVARYGFYKLGLAQEQCLVSGVRAMIEFWGDFTPPQNNPKTLEAMLGALDDYLVEYPLAEDRYTPLQLPDGPAVEFTFSIPTYVMHPITGSPILFGGRFDMLAEFMGGQFLAVVDEKTTKGLGPAWAKQWEMRGQFIGYCFAATYYGYTTNCAVVRGVAILKTMYKHVQAIVEFDQWQLERWWSETNFKIARMVRAWENDEFTHSYGDGCSGWGGCVMMPLCTTQFPEEQFNNYQTRVWDPLKKDPTWPEGGPQYETIGNIKDLLP